MIRHLRNLCFFGLTFFSVLAGAESAPKLEACGVARVESGSECKNLSVKFDIESCEPGVVASAPKVSCDNVGQAVVVARTAGYTYRATFKRGETSGWGEAGLWVPVGKVWRSVRKNAAVASEQVAMEPVPIPAVVAPMTPPSPVAESAQPNIAKPAVVEAPPTPPKKIEEAPVTEYKTPSVSPTQPVATSPMSHKGKFAMRSEEFQNKGFARNNIDFTVLAIDLGLTFKADPQTEIFFQPKFVKTLGANTFVPTSTAVIASQQTSATTYDSALSVHQAYFKYNVTDRFSVLGGRQELNYGDQLIVGGSSWNPTGRSFDLIALKYTHSLGWLDFFSSKIIDRNTTASSTGDSDFLGLYTNWKLTDYIQELDFYAFYKRDAEGADPLDEDFTTMGVRMKSKHGSFDYRFEGTGQFGEIAGDHHDGSQLDFEVGAFLRSSRKIRIALEYFIASKNYRQLFPSGHKWLGYADLFSRRNVQGMVGHFSVSPSDTLTMELDYHVFQRVESNTAAFKFDGTSYGLTSLTSSTANTDDDIGSELDFTLRKKLTEKFNLAFGYSIFIPGSYIEDTQAIGEERVHFGYLQAVANY